MTKFSLIDRFQNDKAIRTLWSPNPAERAMATTFLRLGDQLEAQWENNDLQRRLCRIAVRTNDMLSDMGDSLDELRAGQEKTNELLAKSLAVQTDHYMLEKRERVLKDALFRWNDLLTTGEGLSDPHWVLVASRTFLDFLKSWDFTTEDLEDANEKRSLLGLMKHARGSIKDTPQEIVAEVNVFQSLYGDFAILRDPAFIAEIQAQQFVYEELPSPPPIDDIKNLVDTYVGSDAFGQIFVSTNSSYAACPPQENLLAFVRMASEGAKSAGETPVLAIYGVSSHAEPSMFGRLLATATRQRCILMTDTAVHAYSTTENPSEPMPNSKMIAYKKTGYRDHTGLGFGAMSLDAELKSILVRAETLACAIRNRVKEVTDQRRDDARQRWEQDRANAVNQVSERIHAAAECINRYLDAHPLVEQFYARA
jgi:hypothetical protein